MFKKSIPNTITVFNLLCGCLSVVSAFEGHLTAAAFFIIGGSVFDFLDGFSARLLHVSSLLGKQLDSLSDVITFGMAPAVIMYQLMAVSEGIPFATEYSIKPMAFVAFLVVIFSALRLARFNIDERQAYGFIGLPTPANALFIASLPLIQWYYADNTGTIAFISETFTGNYYFLASLTLITSYLLIAELPLLSFKFITYDWSANKLKYIFILISLVLIIIFNFLSIPLIIIFYILLSVFNNLFLQKNKNHAT